MATEQKTEQFTCECGKQYGNRGDLEKHRQSCATAQASSGMSGSSSGGQKTRGAGGSSGTTNE